MPLNCGPNPFTGRLRRHADATEAVSAYDFAEQLALDAVRQLVRAFVHTLSCPSQGCPTLRYDQDGLRTSVNRVWGGPSPDLAGHYRVVVEAEYRFDVFCDAAPPPPAPVTDPPPMPDTGPGPTGLPWWLERLLRIACLHFCAFKEAGSDFGYTHVHLTEVSLLPGDPGNRVTGVGHDDHTNPDDPHHTTVSRAGTCGFDPTGPDTALQPPDFNETFWMDIYFTQFKPGEPCPEGYFLYECDCGTMCYTFLRPAFNVWYSNQRNPDRPPKKLRDELEKQWRFAPGD